MEANDTMDDAGTPLCPYCAEPVSARAVRCPHCRSRIHLSDPQRWHRAHPDRKLAGVCTALAHALALPVTPIRLAFVVFTLLHFTGALAYLALWLVIPREPGHEPPLVRAVGWTAETVRRLFGGKPRDGRGAGDIDISRVP
jgi:phage shock protein PspC (stress-responsive transcriptional regulator)